MYVMPGSLTSSVNAPLPVIRRGSSRRLMELPKSRDTAMTVSPFRAYSPTATGRTAVVCISSAAARTALTIFW